MRSKIIEEITHPVSVTELQLAIFLCGSSRLAREIASKRVSLARELSVVVVLTFQTGKLEVNLKLKTQN